MKIFVITKTPFPEGMASANRIKALCKGWNMSNLETEVLIFTRTERYGVPPKNINGSGVYEGIPFRYVKGTPLRESNVFLRRINDWADYGRLKSYLGKHLKVGDVVYMFAPEKKGGKFAKFIRKLGGRFIIELCELPFGTVVETEKTISLRNKYEKNVMPEVDGVIAISEALKLYAQKYCSSECKIRKVPILVDFPKYEMPDRSDESEMPYIFHAGSLTEQKDGFVSMLKAFGKIVDKLPFEVKFISTGHPENSRDGREINNIINEYNLKDKIKFTGYISDEDVKNYLAKASFVVINKMTTQQNKYCFSTKLGEYMAASKPIIITDTGEAVNWLTHGKDSYIIKSNDITELANAMKLMFEDKQLRTRLSENAYRTCKDSFSIESNVLRLLDAVTISQNDTK